MLYRPSGEVPAEATRMHSPGWIAIPGLRVPAKVYRPGVHALPAILPLLLYPPEARARREDAQGRISFHAPTRHAVRGPQTPVGALP
jgi:hypothetical protein